MAFDVVIRGTGSYLPERIFTNQEFEALLDTSDEWIVQRTGIRQRRLAAPGEANSDMGLAAARQCLERCNLEPNDVDLIIVPTVTPDTPFPATANWLQGKLGNTRAWSFDINAGCSGFIYGLATATSLLSCGTAKRCLLIGSEKMSALLDFTDRSTCVLFGDGAACVLLEAVESQNNPNGYGVKLFSMGSDGLNAEILYQPAGGSSQPPTFRSVMAHDHYVHMSGREVYSHAIRRMETSILDVLERGGTSAGEIDWFVPHQANARIIETIHQRMELPAERFFVNIDKYGNTTAATIPLCIDEMDQAGLLKAGDKLVLFTFGTGLTWGSCLLTWGAP
ncbi:MAG: ketoacyl-ACP synthase III [bacterium]|nr:ketoacyl-ACP synthase III [bacterium]